MACFRVLRVAALMLAIEVGLLGCGSKTGLQAPPPCEEDGDCCTGTEETCNGLDDDCDGVADDGLRCFFLDGSPIEAIRTDICGVDFYVYDVGDALSAYPVPDIRRRNTVVIAIHDGPEACGASVAVIADLPNDGDGGRLEASFAITPASGGVLVSDDTFDEGDECVYRPDTSGGSCSWRWDPCCTDGVLLGAFERDFCVRLVLVEPEGVSAILVQDGVTETRPAEFGVPLELCGQTRPAAP